MRTMIVFVVLVLVAPALALAGTSSMSPVVSAKLRGANEVPKGDPNGKGLVVVHLNASRGTVCWSFKGVTGIAKPTQAHIHVGGKGVSGNVVVPFGGAYKATGCIKATKSLIEKIESNPSAYYVNIHNAKYPAGAIRGQLVAGMTG
jgi:hypothetical protein